MQITYPTLNNTPIKEIIFDLQFHEDLDNSFYQSLDFEKSELKDNFKSCVPLMMGTFRLSDKEFTKRENEQLGFVFKSESEMLFIRRESFTYHYIEEYNSFEELEKRFFYLIKLLEKLLGLSLDIRNLSIRYVNEINIDPTELASNLIFTYPKQSLDRKISNYQYVTEFSYENFDEFPIRILSSKIDESKLLLDITVNKDIFGKFKEILSDLKKDINTMRSLKNRSFFESVTVQTLIKYL